MFDEARQRERDKWMTPEHRRMQQTNAGAGGMITTVTNADAYRDGTIRVDLGGWIRVEDEAPPDTRVLICDRWGRVEIAKFVSVYERWYTDAADLIIPMFWRPLPDPPSADNPIT